MPFSGKDSGIYEKRIVSIDEKKARVLKKSRGKGEDATNPLGIVSGL